MTGEEHTTYIKIWEWLIESGACSCLLESYIEDVLATINLTATHAWGVQTMEDYNISCQSHLSEK